MFIAAELMFSVELFIYLLFGVFYIRLIFYN